MKMKTTTMRTKTTTLMRMRTRTEKPGSLSHLHTDLGLHLVSDYLPIGCRLSGGFGSVSLRYISGPATYRL